jgi:predicted RNA-binding protein with PIN domain
MSDAVDIDPRRLRSAIEFAVAMAEEAAKRKLALRFPKELRSFFGARRLPTGSLGRLYRAIEADPEFRELVARGALPELVDEIGILWLQRPPGWAASVQELVVAAEESEQSADVQAALRRAEKRRVAAERAAVRTRAEIVELGSTIEAYRSELDVLRADLAKAEEAVTEMRAEVVDVRNEARHARDRETAARAKLDAATAALHAATERAGSITAGPSADPAPGLDPPGLDPPGLDPAGFDPARLDPLISAARDLADRLAELSSAASAGSSAPAAPSRRARLSLPGGVISTSAEAARFYARSDAEMLVDGYNVAKLGWPDRSLEQQRQALLDAMENIARRFGTDITVVFDGASVVGAHAGRRRLVRIVYSPEGVTADDVIRDEVRRLPPARAVVVVTNDAEIVRDVRRQGANTLPSNALLATL